jgi:hypothetical protein
MRSFLTALLAFSLTGLAVAQPSPRVIIEDDVSPANALECAALRVAQTAGSANDAREIAARDAWLKSPGVDVAKANAEAAKLASATPVAMAKMSDACAQFEIRAVAPAGG